jgi:hypothetical protein
MNKAVPFSSDFYVATATVIPVVFLTLVLEGGLLEWISRRIKASDVVTMPVRILVSMLQLFAVIVLLAGTVSEILALHVILRKQTTVNTENVIFYSTAFLIILLGITLAGRIPVAFVVQTGPVSLPLEDEEELLWAGRCARLVPRIRPWMWGKLFLTNERIVWMTNRELGLLAAPTIEIKLENETEISVNRRSPGWIEHLPSSGLIPFSYRGYYFDITVGDRQIFHFCVAVREEEFEELTGLLMRLLTQSDSIEPIKPSGLGWPRIDSTNNTTALCRYMPPRRRPGRKAAGELACSRPPGRTTCRRANENCPDWPFWPGRSRAASRTAGQASDLAQAPGVRWPRRNACG